MLLLVHNRELGGGILAASAKLLRGGGARRANQQPMFDPSKLEDIHVFFFFFHIISHSGT